MLRAVLSIFAGLLAGVLTAVLITTIFVFSESLWGNGQDALNTGIVVCMVIILITGCLASGFVTAFISTMNSMVYPVVTGVILSVLVAVITGLDHRYVSANQVIAVVSSLPLTALGGWIGFRFKQYKQSRR